MGQDAVGLVLVQCLWLVWRSAFDRDFEGSFLHRLRRLQRLLRLRAQDRSGAIAAVRNILPCRPGARRHVCGL